MIIFLFPTVFASFISSSTVQSCTNDGTSPLNCSQKLVISMSVENLQANGTETLEATLTSVNLNSTEQNLAYPIKISIQKSRVRARYAINYIQDFNNQAKELLIAKSVFDCDDGAESQNPTCGWKYDESKKKIWDSQGYCCNCNFEDFLGINQGSYERGYACQAFNLGKKSATAFCLVWDDLWYSAYEITQYQITYEIIVTITSATKEGKYTSVPYTLSPSYPLISTPNVMLKIIGDFSPISPPPSFDSKILFTASKPISNYRVLVGSPFWIIADRSMVTFDGSECNKIGTSYTGFRSQGNKCSMPVNSCFSNQLEDLYQEDIKRQSNNQTPLYFITRYGNFTMVKETNTKYLELQLTGTYSSLITLTMQADNLKLITTVSKGVIDYAEINNFEAATLDGTLAAQVTNVGNIVSNFILSFDCSQGVSPIAAYPLSLRVLESTQIISKVTVEYENAKEYYCNLTLVNSIGEITDVKSVNFNTSDRHTDQGSQGGKGNRPDGETDVSKDEEDLTCDDYCPSWYDVPCFIVKSCWSRILGFIGIILTIIIVFIALKVIIRRYGICFQKCCVVKNSENTQRNSPVNILSQHDESGQKCFFNSDQGFSNLSANKPASLKGRLISNQKNQYFLSDSGKKYLLSSSQIIKHISSVPEHEVIK